MRMDLTVTEYDTYDDLMTYVHGSAAVIGLEMVPVLEPVVPREVADQYAADLGIAFQLSNFVRDVGEDLRRGRVYLPTTLADLRRFVDAGEVTGVEGVVPDADDEVAEYAALMQAAADSQELLAGPGRRVVVVAETPDPDAAVPLRHVVAVHADPADRPSDADPDEDLAWFASQEIADLLGL